MYSGISTIPGYNYSRELQLPDYRMQVHVLFKQLPVCECIVSIIRFYYVYKFIQKNRKLAYTMPL